MALLTSKNYKTIKHDIFKNYKLTIFLALDVCNENFHEWEIIS